MTREMNKPEYHVNWYYRVVDRIDECTVRIVVKPELNPDIAEFVDNLNRSLER